MFAKLASTLDRVGLRRVVAKAANLAYSGRSFSVDAHGHWVNEQPECTIVSPVPHTASFEGFRQWVLHNWTYGYEPKPGDVVVDLGSCAGEEAVVFSKMVGPEGRVIAVEAEPDIFVCLQETVARSGLDNVTPVHCAIADTDGETRFGGGASHLTNAIGEGKTKVPQLTLDTLTKELDRIDFLRTNIEGAEKPMLLGMTESIGKIRNVCISCHDFIGRPAKAEVVAFLEANGFTITTRPGTPPPMRDYVYGTKRQSL